jgi:hypothetical protein
VIKTQSISKIFLSKRVNFSDLICAATFGKANHLEKLSWVYLLNQ